VLLMVTLSASLIYLVDGLFAWAAKQVFWWLLQQTNHATPSCSQMTHS
jgi:hypothetical protein